MGFDSMAIFSLYFLYSLSIALFTFFVYRAATRWRHRLPPGNLCLPFLGETLQLTSACKTENPESFVDDRVSKFGSVFTTHIFGESTVFSADPEINRLILQNEGRLFESSYPSSLSNLLGRHSLLLITGSRHKRLHSLTTSFPNSPIIKDHLLVDIERLVKLNMDSWNDRVILMDEAKKITFHLTVKLLMSFDPCEWTENLMKEYLLVVEGLFSGPFTLFSSTYRRAIRARRKVVEALTLVLRERRKENERGGERKKDLLRALFDEDGNAGGFSDEEIVDFLLSLLAAGYDTTSTVFTLAIKFLTETPEALAQLREEHDEIRARKGETESEALQWDDYKSMHFTQCVVNEALRMSSGGVFRRAITDVNIKGYTIPKGWKVFASFRSVHLNQEYFKDARTFNPWRWQRDGAGETSPANVFVPFGGGQRRCPGYDIARVGLSVCLHHMVTRFSWVPAEKDKFIFFPSTRMQKGYPIIVQARTTMS